MRRPRVLIVDDAATIRKQICLELEADFECTTAVHGKEGLATALALLPDAIVSDIEMPEMTGLEMLIALKGNPATRAIPVVMCTTVTSVNEVNACRSNGCAGYVLKPVEGTYLRAKLLHLTQMRTAGK